MMWYDWYMHISFVAYIINIIIMLLCCSNKYCELGTYKLVRFTYCVCVINLLVSVMINFFMFCRRKGIIFLWNLKRK